MNALAKRIVARYLTSVEEPVGYGTPRGWEHRKEKDEAVERDIEAMSPHLKALWRKMKNQFKGSPQRRLEMFIEYVHEHPDEGMELLQDEADRDLAKMIKELEHRHWEPIKDEPTPSAETPTHWEPYDDGIPFA